MDNIKDYLKPPQWVTLLDYDLTGKQAFRSIEEREKKLGRYVLRSTYIMGRFGKYKIGGKDQCVDALIYQYTMITNPRHVSYAYKLIIGDRVVESNGELGSRYEAEQQVYDLAKKHIAENQ